MVAEPEPPPETDDDHALEQRLRRLVEEYWRRPRDGTTEPPAPPPSLSEVLAMIRSLSLALSLACAAFPAGAESLADRVDRIAAHYQRLPITGMTIAVMQGDALLHARGYGLARLDPRVPARADTVYEIGSITKQFTAAAVLRLAEAGAFGLDDPVARHFPELEAVAEGATLRHLLAHTSGLSSAPISDDLTRPVDAARVPGVLATRAREFAPGARFRYNNNGYLLLGRLIEQATGEAYDAHLQRVFFKPLGLRHTAACPAKRTARAALGYAHPTRGPAVPAPHAIHHPDVSRAAGALCSTAGDLLRWQRALVGGRAVSAASFAAMTTPAPLASGARSPYGLGAYSDGHDDDRHVHHGGAASGFVTQLGYFPKDQLGVVVLTNGMYAPGLVEQIEGAVRDAARGVAFVPPTAAPLSEAERASVLGRFQVGPATIDVYLQGDDLRAEPSGQVATRLIHAGGRSFVAEHDARVRMTFNGPAERADALTLSIGGRAMPAGTRVPEAGSSEQAR